MEPITSHDPTPTDMCAPTGIGAAIVRCFLTAGAHVVMADVEEGAARELADELGERAIAMHCDVTCAPQLRDAAALHLAPFTCWLPLRSVLTRCRDPLSTGAKPAVLRP